VKRRSISRTLVLAAFVAGSPSTVNAFGRPADEREAQRNELYRQAVKEAEAGRWAAAKERLRAVLSIRSSPKVLFSLAQAEEQLGELATAQGDYARALEAAAREGKGDVVHAAEQAQRALLPRVPHLRLVLSGGEPAAGDAASPGASATLDDHAVPCGEAVALDPGEHHVVVRAPGSQTVAVTVKATEGERIDLPVSLEPERTTRLVLLPVPSRPSPSSDSRVAAEPLPRPASPLKAVGIVTASLGLVALGAGAAFGVASLAKHDDAARACPGATCSDANGANLWHDAVTLGDVSTIALVAGGVAFAGGFALWLAAPSSSSGGTQVGFGLGSVQLRGAW
jgi:hypothetical protein